MPSPVFSFLPSVSEAPLGIYHGSAEFDRTEKIAPVLYGVKSTLLEEHPVITRTGRAIRSVKIFFIAKVYIKIINIKSLSKAIKCLRTQEITFILKV